MARPKPVGGSEVTLQGVVAGEGVDGAISLLLQAGEGGEMEDTAGAHSEQ